MGLISNTGGDLSSYQFNSYLWRDSEFCKLPSEYICCCTRNGEILCRSKRTSHGDNTINSFILFLTNMTCWSTASLQHVDNVVHGIKALVLGYVDKLFCYLIKYYHNNM